MKKWGCLVVFLANSLRMLWMGFVRGTCKKGKVVKLCYSIFAYSNISLHFKKETPTKNPNRNHGKKVFPQNHDDSFNRERHDFQLARKPDFPSFFFAKLRDFFGFLHCRRRDGQKPT